MTSTLTSLEYSATIVTYHEDGSIDTARANRPHDTLEQAIDEMHAMARATLGRVDYWEPMPEMVYDSETSIRIVCGPSTLFRFTAKPHQSYYLPMHSVREWAEGEYFDRLVG